jgi:hypothetical protein
MGAIAPANPRAPARRPISNPTVPGILTKLELRAIVAQLLG